MKKILVKHLMVRLSEYATVHQDSHLIDAIFALEEAQKKFEASPYVHRAILAYDDNNQIVGKLSQWDVIKSLEPKYDYVGDLRSTSLSGLSPEFIKSMMEKQNLWQEDIDVICSRVSGKKVKDVMYTLTDQEKIDFDATLGEALHMFVIGHHQSLLVRKGDRIVGILRLVDVFKLLCDRIKACGIKRG
ncbi:MAG: CBS domain-containing protein [Deltaproteobacteria bacterium]|nr:CBS domain-containing protein [Deltaproteobacteria bacterium]MBW1995121.1 CBS domain-containing protein [Deltaproteobacteria bacterium]MBW2154180.1 CBS domain-containing protein [Deltaproteobacteria bacterium]